MQQEGGGGGGGGAGAGGQQQSHQYGEMAGAVSEATSTEQMVVEAASPISSRPPAGGNLDEFMRLASSVGGGDELGLGGGSGGGGGGSGGGGTSGNRWPRQETLALLKIRSDMDTTFRDATVKGPLWEDVSRKMAELGFKRSAKKCREKFENVHKYYKRTKETRAGRQDGKSYKFFSELEAFHTPPATVSIPATAIATTLDVAPVSVGIPMPISAARIIPPPTTAVPMSSSLLPMPGSAPAAPVSFPPQQPALAPVSAPASAPTIATTAAQFGISFSSNSSTFSQGFDDDDDDEDEVGVGGGEPSSMAGTSRKRKRSSSSRGSGGGTTRKMMEFFEGLMKQVMQKQEAMQQRFLEAIEKREQDRTIREEAWKRQESARLTREHELMAQERSIAASRDAAIISFLQKITGQTIQLPTTVIIPAAAPPPPPPPSQPATPVVQPAQPNPTTAPPLQQPPPPPPPQQQQSLVSHHHQHQQHKHHQHQQRPISSEIVMAIPEQQVPPSEIGGSGGEPASSRWPKAEVLALINLRTGLESRYQEAGPKGPLWEEISAAMSRLGYNRNPKRCKEKWENINKYFKKVKESNKKRPEDAKTCPYFHQLDALYSKKILGGGGGTSSGSFSDHNRPEEPPSTAAAPQQSEHETGATANVVTGKEGNDGATKEPEDIVRELMDEHRKGLNRQQQHNHQGQSFMVDGYDKIDEPESDNMEDDEEVDEEDYDEEEEDEELEEEKKMGYKIEFQRQNPSSNPNGGGGNNNGAPSFFTMVQ